MKQPLIHKISGKDWIRTAAHLLIAVLIFSALLCLLDRDCWSDYSTRTQAGGAVYVEPEWRLESEGQVLLEGGTLPPFMALESGRPYRAVTTLTYNGAGDDAPYGFFDINHMYCRVTLEGETLFSYMSEDIPHRDRSRSPGIVYASFPMPEDCRGRELAIELIPALSIDMEYKLPEVRFEDYSTMMDGLFWQDLRHNLVTLIFAFLGAGAILLSAISLKGTSYREGVSIGVFALVFSIYNLTECDFNLFMISNPYYTYLLNYAGLSLVLVSFLAFMRERFSGIQQKACSVLLGASAVLIAAEAGLHFTGLRDLREFLPLLQFAFFVAMIVIFVLLAMPKTKKRGAMAIQLLPILVGMMIDAAIYYRHWTISSNNAAFTSVGVLLFLVLEVRHVWQSSVAIYTESIRSRQYQQMAYIDGLTEVGNRRAFETEKAQIQSGEKQYETLLIVSIDVNNLKVCNDSMGHAAGDELIRSTASALLKFADAKGSVFRTGGDEFYVFLYDVSMEEYQRLVRETEARIAAYNETTPIKLSMAYGCAWVRDGLVAAAVEEADHNMYRNKKEKKAVRK